MDDFHYKKEMQNITHFNVLIFDSMSLFYQKMFFLYPEKVSYDIIDLVLKM